MNFQIEENKKETEVTPSTSHLPKVSLEVKDLPSKSLSYPPGTTVSHRPYTFGEVKRISQSKLGIKDTFKEILKGVETNLPDKGMLTVPDVLFLGLLRKISTFGSSKFSVAYHCSHCDKGSTFDLSADQIDFAELSVPRLPIKISLSNDVEYVFTPITINDYNYLVDKELADDELAILAVQCRSGGFEKNLEEFNNCNMEDGQILSEVDKLLKHEVKPVKNKCNNKLDDNKVCGGENNIELDGGRALVLPFRKLENVNGSRIRFGD
jgi:hypothetical protein